MRTPSCYLNCLVAAHACVDMLGGGWRLSETALCLQEVKAERGHEILRQYHSITSIFLLVEGSVELSAYVYLPTMPDGSPAEVGPFSIEDAMSPKHGLQWKVNKVCR